MRIYTTNISSDYRISTLMQDPVYRLAAAWQNNHYAQPPHVSYFLGHQTTNFPIPEIYVIDNGKVKYNTDLNVKDISEIGHGIGQTSVKITNEEKTANTSASPITNNKNSKFKYGIINIKSILIVISLLVILGVTFLVAIGIKNSKAN